MKCSRNDWGVDTRAGRDIFPLCEKLCSSAVTDAPEGRLRVAPFLH